MPDPDTRLGTQRWVARTGGHLTPSERRTLVRSLAAIHAINAVGRTTMLLRVNAGRRALVPPSSLRPPTSALTVAAQDAASRLLSPSMLHHAHRTFLFGAALAHLEHVDVDSELLFAAAMLHDIGLQRPVPGVDHTRSGTTVALDVAEKVGLSTAATTVLRDAIALHLNPRVTSNDHGSVACLLSAGAALDAVGLHSWKVPAALLEQVAAEFPRLAFRRELSAAVAAEAANLPTGRVHVLNRLGALRVAIRLAPFRD